MPATAAQKKGTRAAQKEARPKEIVEAALAIFARDGFAGTRLEDVAERVGISKGTIYLYFENKEELFKACVRETLGSHVKETMELAAAFDGPTPDLLREIVRRISGRLTKPAYRTILLLLISEGQRFPELVSFYHSEIIGPGAEGLGGVIQRGIDRGEFKETGLSKFPMMLMSPVIASVIWNHLFGDDVEIDPSEALQTHLDTMLDGLKA
ncbi:MAG: TetR family transcriptional regulator [Alphaproteobacteria bacterium]|nr:TetR family transcriptional regulator [Alphaproteobacteria bacterium]